MVNIRHLQVMLADEDQDRILTQIGSGHPYDLFHLAAEVAPKFCDARAHALKDVRLFFSILCHIQNLSNQNLGSRKGLLGFLMQGVFAAETAVFVPLKSVGVVFLVLLCVVVSLLAFAACQGNFDSHIGTSC